MSYFDDAGSKRPRRPSYKGGLVMDVSGGVFRVRRWPSPRATRPTTEAKERQDKFRFVQRIIQYMVPEMQRQVREAVQGTPLLPRDLLTSMAYNRLLYVVGVDGRKLYPMAARVDVSASLDVLSQLPGTILYRGPEFWQWLGPGSDGQILTIGPDGMPQWITFDSSIVADAEQIDPTENTGSTVFDNLATVGPQVTIITGTKAACHISASAARITGGFGNNAWISVEVAGSSNVPASDSNAQTVSAYEPGFSLPMAGVIVFDGLTPGVNTFTMKYRVNGNVWSFGGRGMSVFAL